MILAWLVLATITVSVSTAVLAATPVRRQAGWFASAGFAAIGVALAVQAPRLAHVSAESVPEVRLPYLPSLGVEIALRLDGLGLFFGLIVLGVGALVTAYSASYLSPGRHVAFYGFLTFFAVAMLTLVLADDVVLLWAAWELTTLCSFLLISQTGPKGREPALRTLTVTFGGGLCLLSAISLMWAVTGTTALSQILTSPAWQQYPGVLTVTAAFVVAAAATKAAQFPFHAWLPDAMVASTPVSAYLHAAAMVKAGIFLLLRMSPLFVGTPLWHVALVCLGLTTAVLGAVTALKRFDLKEMLAYSTISQLGFLVTLIGIGTIYALVGAVVHVLSHALFKSALFMSVGMIDHEAGTRDLRRLSGLGRAMPVTSTLLVLAAASMAGLPPLFGFVSKEALFKGTTTAAATLPGDGFSQATVMAVLVLAAAFTVAYSARMVLTTLPGAPMPRPPHEAPVQMWLPVAVAVAAGVVLGVAGPLAAPLLDAAAQVAAGPHAHTDLGLWHGLEMPLLMSVTALGLGAVLVAFRVGVAALLRRVTSPVRALDVVDGFRLGLAHVGGVLNQTTRHDAVSHHLLPVATVLAGLMACLTYPLALGVDVGWGRPVDWLVLVVVGLAVAATARARTRVGLVTSVGVIGFGLSLLYFQLGAPDVALTGLLVETLTVVMMVMLLVRLPHGFHKTRPRRRQLATLLGTLVGVGGFSLALAIQGTTAADPVGHWYTRHAYELTHGANVVNTILTDFRAMDTLGEMTALGVAGIVLKVTLDARGLLPLGRDVIVARRGDPAVDASDNMVVLRVVDVVVGPLLVVMAGWFYLRGHHDPGGGFIAALVASCGLALVYLSAADREVRRLRGRASALIGTGMLIALVTGLLGMAKGAFLTSFMIPLGVGELGSGMVLDLGVFLTVLGLVMAAIGRLGVQGREESPPIRRRRRVNVIMEDD